MIIAARLLNSRSNCDGLLSFDCDSKNMPNESDFFQHIDQMNEQALSLRYSDMERATELAMQAADLARVKDAVGNIYSHGLATSLGLLGFLCDRRGSYKRAFEYFLQALAIYEEEQDYPAVVETLRQIGGACLQLGDYPEALAYYLKMERIADNVGDLSLRAIAANSLGFLYMRMNDWRKALEYLEVCLSLARDSGDANMQAVALDHCCNCHTHLGEYDLALGRGLSSVELSQEIGNPQLEAGGLFRVGELYQAMGNLDAALVYLQRCIITSDAIGLKLENVRALRRMGEIYWQKNQAEQALELFRQALQLAEDLNFRQEQFCIHESLSRIYRAQNNYAQALVHYEQFHTLKEAVFGEEAEIRLRNLATLHELENTRKEAELYQVKNVALRQEIEIKEQLIGDLSAFSRAVAHDLKSPLGVILGYAGMLKDSRGQMDEEQIEHSLSVIISTTRRMSSIIDELLTLARVSQVEVVSKPLDMGSIVSDVLKYLTSMIQEYQAEIVLPAEWPVASGHSPWLEQVWVNYLSNAIKYGGQPPRVELGATVQPDGSVCFWVHDNGPGIDAKALPNLFKPFVRLGESRTSGHGLGLSIVRRIVEKLGGEVSVQSEGIEGQGCTFSFTLPGAK
jgi:signal transduction histidine kinase